MWILYQLVIGLLLLIAGPFLLLSRGSHYLPTLPSRFGLRRTEPLPHPLWIHAVSVGEVGVAATLASALPDTPLLVTTITPTGQEQARSLRHVNSRADYLPFELGGAIRKFLDHHSPAGLVLVEGDYWPLLLRHVERRNLPIVVVNGRVGDRSYRRMRRLRRILQPLLGRIQAFGVQTGDDRDRLVSLGIDPEKITVTGNLKFEAPSPAPDQGLADQLIRIAAGRPILIAGSTMPGEEEIVLEAFDAAGGGNNALLVLAPRHPERWDAVERLIQQQDLEVFRRSRIDTATREGIMLLDSMGELAALYSQALATFIGGTLVSTGGHNPLEAARFGVAIAAGPSMENFRAMAEQFDRAQAWQRVGTGVELGEVWNSWLDSPESARQVGAAAQDLVEANRGALDRTLRLLRETIGVPEPPASSSADA